MKFNYWHIYNKIGFAVKAPWNRIWDLHNETAIENKNMHYHHFTGIVYGRFQIGIINCIKNKE
jgi:hypothetical protein